MKSLAGLFVLVVGIVGGVFGCDRAANTPHHAVEGVVFDPSGKPLDGVVVILSRGASNRFPDPSAVAISSNGGHFRLEPGVLRTWFVSAVTTDALGYVGPLTPSSPPVELQLRPAAFILRGTVRSQDGRLLAGAHIRAVSFAFPAEHPDAFFQATTSADGRYELPLGDESYLVAALARGFSERKFPASHDATMDFTLPEAAQLRGRVLAGKTGEPVAFANVEAVKTDGRPEQSWEPDLAVADSRGEFAFDSLDSGEYRLNAHGGDLAGFSATSFLATPAIHTTNASITLWPARAISGQVTDLDGKAINGAHVEVWQEGIEAGRERGITTFDGGHFFVDGVLPWHSTVSAAFHGYVGSTTKLDLGSVTGTGVAICLAPGATISGLVVDSRGAPVEAASITVWSAQYSHYLKGFARSDRDSHFKIVGLDSSEIYLEAHKRGRGIAVSPKMTTASAWHGRPASDTRITLKLVAGAGIRGTLRDDQGHPAPDTAVFAQRIGLNHFPDRSEVALSDALGRYEFSGLTPGTWSVGGSRSGAARIGTDAGIYPFIVNLELGPATLGTADLALPQAGLTITGTVGSVQGPVGNALVTAKSADTFGGSALPAITKADGSFTLEGLDSGKWELSVFADGYNVYDRRLMNGKTTVLAGAKALPVHLTRRSTLAGRVIDDEGHPLPDYTVVVGFLYPNLTIHDPAGAFLLDDEVPSNARTLVVKGPDGRSGDLRDLVVTEGSDQTGLTIQASQGVTLAGRLVSVKTGAPLEVTVQVDGVGPGTRTKSKSDGTFSIPHLPLAKHTYLTVCPEPPAQTECDSYSFSTLAKPGRLDLGKLRPILDADTMADIFDRGSLDLAATWSTSGAPVIFSVAPKGEAEKAGIHVGDRLLAIDGRDASGIGSSGFRWLFSGKPGSSVMLSIAASGGPPRDVTLTRGESKRQSIKRKPNEGSGSDPKR